jgi:hypothetical protein
MTTRKHVFYGILALVSLLGLGITQSARAYNVTLQEVGSSVVATGSGAFNLTGLTFNSTSTGNFGPFISGSLGLIRTGAYGFQGVDQFTGFTGPTSVGSGNVVTANTGSGGLVGINGSNGFMFVPQGYASGTALSDSMTFNNRSFATLGVTPGTYVWTWGTGANQNFTLQIGPAGVPDVGSTLSLLSFALLGVAVLRRKLRC